jgi:phosphoribosylanthranilate isomerase
MWVKFCGIVRPEDMEFAVALEVDAVGVIAVPDSQRCVSEQEALRLATVPRHTTKLILVLSDPTESYMNDMIEILQPDFLQFHGSESREWAGQLPFPYIKAVRGANFDALWHLRKHKDAFAWLVDAPKLGRENEILLSKVRNAHEKRQLILAGGLRPEMIADTIRHLDIWGVDVSRGIESVPREKDHEKMKRFIDAVRTASLERV